MLFPTFHCAREREMHNISAVAERNNSRYAGTLEDAKMLLEFYI